MIRVDCGGDDERRALTPLFWSHINPYGRFRLNIDTHLDLSGTSSTGTGGVKSVLYPTVSAGDRLAGGRGFSFGGVGVPGR